MIISASRRTDIPAFYSNWMLNRLKAGYCKTVNPFNRSQVKTVSLARNDVEMIVFWTKNPEPMLSLMPDLKNTGIPFGFLYTINDYPAIIEPHVPDITLRIDVFRELAAQFSPTAMVWRYDPILLSRKFTADYHLKTFTGLARQLKGFTGRVIISLIDFYRKTERKMREVETQTGDVFMRDLYSVPDLPRLVTGLIKIAAENNMLIQSCCESEQLADMGIPRGKCIDDKWVENVSGLKIDYIKDKGQRKNCGCMLSTDIGAVNSCPHGCVYCYSTSSRATALNNMAGHDPDSAFMLW